LIKIDCWWYLVAAAAVAFGQGCQDKKENETEKFAAHQSDERKQKTPGRGSHRHCHKCEECGYQKG